MRCAAPVLLALLVGCSVSTLQLQGAQPPALPPFAGEVVAVSSPKPAKAMRFRPGVESTGVLDLRVIPGDDLAVTLRERGDGCEVYVRGMVVASTRPAASSAATFAPRLFAGGGLESMAKAMTESASAATPECGALSPARPAPECVTPAGEATPCGTAGAVRLWPPALRPETILSDASSRRGGTSVPAAWRGHPLIKSLDVVGDRLWVAFGAGLMGFDVGGARVRRLATVDGFARSGDPADSGLLSFPPVSEQLNFIFDIDAERLGTVDVVFVSGKPPVGPSVWTYDGISLVQRYQDAGGSAVDVEIVEHGGTLYGLAIGQDGISLYDLTAAAARTSPCLDDQGETCPGVYIGRIPGHRTGRTVGGDAVVRGDRLYVVHSASGVGSPVIASVTLPPRVTGGVIPAATLWTGTDIGQDVDQPLFFERAGAAYLAYAQGTTVRVHQVDACLDLDGCASLPPAVWSAAVPNPWSTGQYHLTYSEDGGRAFLYLGQDGSRNAAGIGLDRLWDVTGIGDGVVTDLSAGGGTYTDPCNGTRVDYLGRYNMGNHVGVNEFHPRHAVVAGGRLYRAGESLLDVHALTLPPPGEPEDDGVIFHDGFERGDTAAWKR